MMTTKCNHTTNCNGNEPLRILFVTSWQPFQLRRGLATVTRHGRGNKCERQLRRWLDVDRLNRATIRKIVENERRNSKSDNNSDSSTWGTIFNSNKNRSKTDPNSSRKPPARRRSPFYTLASKYVRQSSPSPSDVNSNIPSNVSTPNDIDNDVEGWPWSYEVDNNPILSTIDTDNISRKYPPGKLPFALELDFVLNHPIADAVIAFLVSLNCLIFALQTIDVGPSLHDAFFAYEKNLSILFVIEYFGRWYGKGLSPRYLFSRGMLVDFIAVAPYGFTAVADQSEALFVRILRLSRILRIQRVVMDTDRSDEVMGSLSQVQVRLASVGLSLFSLLYVSAGLFFQAEKDVNPNVLNFFDAFYYSTITLFTVGFGDVTPLTSWGRMITVLTVLSGAVLVPYQLSEIERVRQISKKEEAAKEFETITERTIASATARSASTSSSSAINNGDSTSPTNVFIAVNDADIECKRCNLKGHQKDARFCRNCGALISKRRFDPK